MSRSVYAPREEYIGTGALAEYSFDFKIEELSQLEVIEMSDLGVETQRVRGTDITYINSVTFDSIDGGGIVHLKTFLPKNYEIIILEANDAPTQPYEFRNKSSFTLRRIESALDFLGGAIQRLAYLVGRSIKLHESDSGTDPQLPPLAGQSLKYIRVKEDESGFEFADPNVGFPSKNVEVQREDSGSTVGSNTDVYMGDTDGGSFAVSLISGVDGDTLKVVNTGTSGNRLTVTPDGTDLLLGTNTTFILDDGEALELTYQIVEGWF